MLRDWLYVADHCRAIWQVLEVGRPGEVYSVGNERNLQVVTTLCRLLDELLPDSPYCPHCPHSRLRTFIAARPGHDTRYTIDARKLRSELGWKPREDFESRLWQTRVWYLENQTWCKRVMDGSQLEIRLDYTVQPEPSGLA